MKAEKQSKDSARYIRFLQVEHMYSNDWINEAEDPVSYEGIEDWDCLVGSNTERIRVSSITVDDFIEDENEPHHQSYSPEKLSELSKDVHSLVEALAEAISEFSRDIEPELQEQVGWCIDEAHKRVAFRGQDSIGSCPTYYYLQKVERMAKQSPWINLLLIRLLEMGYKIERWFEDEDTGRWINLLQFIDLDEYNKLLLKFPPKAIQNAIEAEILSNVIKKMSEDEYSQTIEHDMYVDLLSSLLQDWENRKSTAANKQTPIYSELQLDDIPF